SSERTILERATTVTLVGRGRYVPEAVITKRLFTMGTRLQQRYITAIGSAAGTLSVFAFTGRSACRTHRFLTVSTKTDKRGGTGRPSGELRWQPAGAP